MSLLHAIGFHQWLPVSDEPRPLWHTVRYVCAVLGCRARRERWESWDDGHRHEEIEAAIEAQDHSPEENR